MICKLRQFGCLASPPLKEPDLQVRTFVKDASHVANGADGDAVLCLESDANVKFSRHAAGLSDEARMVCDSLGRATIRGTKVPSRVSRELKCRATSSYSRCTSRPR